MNDRELLEMAAKAAGINVDCWDEDPFDTEYSHNHKPAIRTADFPRWWWNPLEDDGDALRLAVKLRLTIMLGSMSAEAVEVSAQDDLDDDCTAYARESLANDPLAATRRAIVRAAAEIIWKAMP